MSSLRQALGSISGSRVLDVATGDGSFIQTLVENLESYTEIIGIDAIEYTKAAGSVFCVENVHFCQMDAARLGFEDECFDTVSISSALHHLESIPPCVAEMKRVLKPGGYLIIRETHQDVQTESQLSDMYIHHWVAEIDSALGFTHNRTFSRQELVGFVKGLSLCNVVFYDISNTDLDPVDETAIQESEAAIDRYIRYAKGLSDYETLKERGEELRRWLHKVGIQWEPELIAVGVK
jgi:SAM-dependent methyltransferase